MELLSATWTPDSMGKKETADQQVELFADNVTIIEPDSLPHGGRHEGLAAYRALQAAMSELWEQTIESTEYWPSGDERVTLRIVITWRARSTGRSATIPMIDLLRFEDGLIVEVEAFVRDTAALLATLDPA